MPSAIERIKERLSQRTNKARGNVKIAWHFCHPRTLAGMAIDFERYARARRNYEMDLKHQRHLQEVRKKWIDRYEQEYPRFARAYELRYK